MGVLKRILEKETMKELLVFCGFMLTIYLFRDIKEIFLLTFLFTYLIYTLQEFIVKKLKKIIKVKEVAVTILLYSLIFFFVGYFVFKYVPIIVSETFIIINKLVGSESYYDISKIEDFLTPIIGSINMEQYIKNEANSIFEFIENVGKWGINIVLSLILSLFFMIEKGKISCFWSGLHNSRISGIHKYLDIFGKDFLNSFGKVIQAQILIAITNTIFSVVFLSIMDFPQLIALAFMIFIFSLVPVAGTILTLIPLSIIAFNIGGVIKIIYVLAMVGLLYALESCVLNPQFMSAKTKLPVFFVFIIIIASDHFLGLWGILLGIPLVIFVLNLLKIDFN